MKKADKNMMYKTSDLAKQFHVHPNTIRLYESLELISTPKRTQSGYRIFESLHVKQFEFAKLGFQIEVLQGGLRKKMVEVIKLVAKKEYDKAYQALKMYQEMIESETKKAKDAVLISHTYFKTKHEEETKVYTRSEVSQMLDISVDQLRNWEMNGLIHVKRKKNRYRIYDLNDINQIKIIRALRYANYSLSSILRLFKNSDLKSHEDIEHILDHPEQKEEIISTCDHLLTSLHQAHHNVNEMFLILEEIKKL